jgi:hypothetical protein
MKERQPLFSVCEDIWNSTISCQGWFSEAYQRKLARQVAFGDPCSAAADLQERLEASSGHPVGNNGVGGPRSYP